MPIVSSSGAGNASGEPSVTTIKLLSSGKPSAVLTTTPGFGMESDLNTFNVIIFQSDGAIDVKKLRWETTSSLVIVMKT